jgi:hypothetical protein
MESVKSRRRRRGRLAAVSGSAAAVVVTVVVAGMVSAGAATRPTRAGGQPPQVPATSNVQPPQVGYTQRPVPAWVKRLQKTVVPTGVRVSGGEIVLYAVPLCSPDLPGVSFGLTAGVRSGTGAVRGLVTMNETSGSDRSPGFHAVQAPGTHNGVAVPEFGYYAGPAVKITGRVGGKVVRAGSAAPGREDIVVFWFGPAARGTVTGLTAYDRTGHKLPAGTGAAGLG